MFGEDKDKMKLNGPRRQTTEKVEFSSAGNWIPDFVMPSQP